MMHRFKEILIVLFIVISFVINIDDVKAIKTDNGCKNQYFTIKEDYSESVGWNNYYDKGKLKVGRWINGETVKPGTWTSTGVNTTAYFFRTENDENLSSDAQIAIRIANNNGYNTLCTEIITNFDTSKNHVKVMLYHTGKTQWVSVFGTFKNNGKNYGPATPSTSVNIDNTAAILYGDKTTIKETAFNGNSTLLIDLLFLDPKPAGWGKFDEVSSKVTSCKYSESGGSSKDCDIKNTNSSVKTENSFTFLDISTHILNNFSKDKEYNITLGYTWLKKSGKKGTGNYTFKYKNGSIVNTTTSPTSAITDKNGNSASDAADNIDNNSSNGPTHVNGPQKGSTREMVDLDSAGGKTSCTDVSYLIGEYWGYVMIIIPILLLVMMTIDFFSALGKGDAEALKKSTNKTIKRVIATVVLLMLPTLIRFIFGLFGLEFCL